MLFVPPWVVAGALAYIGGRFIPQPPKPSATRNRPDTETESSGPPSTKLQRVSLSAGSRGQHRTELHAGRADFNVPELPKVQPPFRIGSQPNGPAPKNTQLATPSNRWRRVSLFSSDRRQQLEELRAGRSEENLPRERKRAELQQNINLSGTSLALVVAGFWNPVFTAIAAPLMFFGAARLVRYAYEDWRNEGPVAVSSLDAVATTGLLFFGPWLAPATILFTCCIARKLVHLTEDASSAQVMDLFETDKLTVWLDRDGTEVSVMLGDVAQGDIVVVAAGEVLPVDGTVTRGIARVDQQALTGESQPSDKSPGEPVLAASMVLEGRLWIRVDRAGSDSLAGRLVEVISKSRSHSDDAWSRGQRIVEAAAIPTLGLAFVTMPFLGVVRGLAVMECSFGASLRYSGPIAALNHLQIASEMQVLIKDGRALERMSAVDTVVFDKTGTLTRDAPTVGAISLFADYDEDEILRLAAAAEQKQQHPIARAIREAAEARELDIPPLQDEAVVPGHGLSVLIEERQVLVGSNRLLAAEGVPFPDELASLQASMVFVAVDGQLVAALELLPEIRAEAPALVRELKRRGLSLAIISGDREEPTRHLAEQLGIDNFYAEVLPDGKSTIIDQMRAEGRSVCYIGDGINDALALRAANVSISMRGATTVATDAASVVMMRGDLTGLTPLLDLAGEFDRNLYRSTVITFVPGVISLTGVYLFGFGIAIANAFANTSVILGVINGMLPALKVRDFGDPTPEDSDPSKQPRRIGALPPASSPDLSQPTLPALKLSDSGAPPPTSNELPRNEPSRPRGESPVLTSCESR